ncbi:MAG: RecQ family ATP-dependent DNA helicase [Thermoplasmatota archaeon]
MTDTQPPLRPEADPSTVDGTFIRELARRHFGIADLRPGQEEVLLRTLRGESVLAVMPTGSGKSLLYQLPGLVTRGTTVVVSPLLALMKDQIDSLDAPKRAAVVSITSEKGAAEVREAISEIANGRYRLVFCAPERLRSVAFLEALMHTNVVRLVVDEAHCIASWGHDFRPDYLALGEARRVLSGRGRPTIPVLALTATAPARVRDEIQRRLGPLVEVRRPILRPNLLLEVAQPADADEKIALLLQIVTETQGPFLVYASSRAKCEGLAKALQGKGIAADFYHAGAEDRPMRQDAFVTNQIRVLVATVAFGMGIDKEDIRTIVHFDPPSSVESYWQEVGRAGRDGKEARCILFATASDVAALRKRGARDVPDLALVDATRNLCLATAGTTNGPAGPGWAEGLGGADGVGAPTGRESLAATGSTGPLALIPRRALDEMDPDGRAEVALALLAEAGFLERRADCPAFFHLEPTPGAKDLPATIARIAGRESTIFEIASALHLDPRDVFPFVLGLASEGNVRVGMSDPDLLVAIRNPAVTAHAARDRAVRTMEARASAIRAYATTNSCRHAALAKHFDDPWDRISCGTCDVCRRTRIHLKDLFRPTDAEVEIAVRDALASVRSIGAMNLSLLLRGDETAPPFARKSQAFGVLAHRSDAAIQRTIDRMRRTGAVVAETLDHGGEALRAGTLGPGLANVAPSPMPRASEAEAPPKNGNADGPELVSDAERALFDKLRSWRMRIARAAGVPAYVVLPDRTLQAIARARPKNTEELLDQPGIGPRKLEMFGEDILRLIASEEDPKA